MIRYFLVLITTFLSYNALASYQITNSEFNMLPPHCQAVYAEMYQRGKTSGLVIKPMKYHPEIWKRRIGSAWTFMNHYCPGLVGLNNAKVSPNGRAIQLEHAGENIKYQITHAKWTPSNSWLLAEAHAKLAEVAELRGQPGEAIRNYEEAIKAYPKSYRIYLNYSKLLAKGGNREQALKVVREGLKQVPKSKTLKRQEKRLMK